MSGTVNVGLLTIVFQGVEILTLIAGAFGIAIRLGRAVERFEQVGVRHGQELTELKGEIKLLKDVVVKVAVQNERIDNLEHRQRLMDDRMEELRHGNGYVVARPHEP
ncbi:MAG: hypothetical protein KGL39_06320 [Patescibacteria group bacterium]|nr:hypothetical protein [Patescibacteria group bacterium]